MSEDQAASFPLLNRMDGILKDAGLHKGSLPPALARSSRTDGDASTGRTVGSPYRLGAAFRRGPSFNLFGGRSNQNSGTESDSETEEISTLVNPDEVPVGYSLDSNENDFHIWGTDTVLEAGTYKVVDGKVVDAQGNVYTPTRPLGKDGEITVTYTDMVKDSYDARQLTLGAAGMVEGVGTAADVAAFLDSGHMYWKYSDSRYLWDAGGNALAAVPLIGTVSGGAQVASRAGRMARALSRHGVPNVPGVYAVFRYNRRLNQQEVYVGMTSTQGISSRLSNIGHGKPQGLVLSNSRQYSSDRVVMWVETSGDFDVNRWIETELVQNFAGYGYYLHNSTGGLPMKLVQNKIGRAHV